MAHRSDDPHAVHRASVALLLLGFVLFYGWDWFPPRLQAQAWNAAGAFARLCLLAAFISRFRLSGVRLGTFTVGRLAWIRRRWPAAVAWCQPVEFAIVARPLLLVAIWWAAEDLMVAGCSIAMMIHPWVVAKGQAQCSALLQFDLGRVGLVIVGMLLLVQPTQACSYEK